MSSNCRGPWTPLFVVAGKCLLMHTFLSGIDSPYKTLLNVKMLTSSSKQSFAAKKTPASNSKVTIFNNNLETVFGKTEKKTQYKDDHVDSTLLTRKDKISYN